jgi:hypothetical protein
MLASEHHFNMMKVRFETEEVRLPAATSTMQRTHPHTHTHMHTHIATHPRQQIPHARVRARAHTHCNVTHATNATPNDGIGAAFHAALSTLTAGSPHPVASGTGGHCGGWWLGRRRHCREPTRRRLFAVVCGGLHCAALRCGCALGVTSVYEHRYGCERRSIFSSHRGSRITATSNFPSSPHAPARVRPSRIAAPRPARPPRPTGSFHLRHARVCYPAV